MRSVPKVDSAALEDTAKSALRRRSARPRDLNLLFVRRRSTARSVSTLSKKLCGTACKRADRLKFRRRHIPLKSHIPRSLKSQLSRVPFGKHSVFPAFDCKLGTLAVLRLKGDKISCVRVCVRISVMSAVLNERDVAAFCDDLCFDRRIGSALFLLFSRSGI